MAFGSGLPLARRASFVRSGITITHSNEQNPLSERVLFIWSFIEGSKKVGTTSFLRQFRFDPSNAGMIGIEMEAWLMRDGKLFPENQRVRREYKHTLPVGVEADIELAATQLELRLTAPVPVRKLPEHVRLLLKAVGTLERDAGIDLALCGYVPNWNPAVTDTERYQQIAARLNWLRRAYACSTAGLHVHVGMRDMETARRAYNRAIGALPNLMERYASPERMIAYKRVTPFWNPEPLASVGQLFALAKEQGFAEDLKRWWALVRISRFGTIEFRVADATRDYEKIVSYAQDCLQICGEVYA